MYDSGVTRTAEEVDAILSLVAEVVEAKLKAKEAFTALDISNTLKGRNYAIRHREVAPLVRAIHDSGAMGDYDFVREQIPVIAEGGKTTQTFLYRHRDSTVSDYQGQAQATLPPVSPASARPLDDIVAAGNPLSPLDK